MKNFKYLLTFACIVFPLSILCYKHYVLDMSIIPKTVSNVWRLEISNKTDNLDVLSEETLRKVRIPIAKNTISQNVQHIEIKPKSFLKSLNKNLDAIDTIKIKRKKSKNSKIQVNMDIRLVGYDYLIDDPDEVPLRKKLRAKEVLKYTSLPQIETSSLNDLKQIASSIVFETDDDLTKLEKFFFYVSDEFILQPGNDSLVDAITLKNGSYLGQARFISALAKVYMIPARISFGIQIIKQYGKKTHKYNRVFYTEAFVNGQWLPINPHQKKFGSIGDDFIVLHQDSEGYADIFNNRDFLSIYVEPLVYENFKTNLYLNELKSQHPFWSSISLHKFSLSIQSIFFGILLIPFGTVVLSFLRVLVGINTFGIFTPILLSLFFLETSLAFGLIFFFTVVIIGLMQRVLLDRFYILAVPRLSILLTIVILLYVGFAIFAESYGLLSVNNNTLNYFPIVIITVFIERFSIYFIEEGAYNTIKTTIGTFTVSLLCYFLLSITLLKELIFNNPELIILAIGTNLLIGNYKGYRLLEFFRFYQIGKEEEKENV